MVSLRHTIILAAAILCLSVSVPAQGFAADRTGLPEKSERRVAYTMQVRLEPSTKTLRGSQRIVYRNRTQRPTDELRFHLYLNAFRNLRSTHLREESAQSRARYKSDDEFGSIRLLALRLPRDGAAIDLLPKLRYVQPDDGNADDRTVAAVPLPNAFEPGTELVIETEFVAKLPKAYRRTGWGPGNFFMVAQWFPKLGVLQDPATGSNASAKAEWYCHQFHAHTEFFADFGSYDVTIDTPKGWPVGATGVQQGESKIEGDREIRRFVQDDVHDFAWTTDPDYRVHEWDFDASLASKDPVTKILAKELDLDAAALGLRNVKVRFLLHPEHDTAMQLARHRRAVDVGIRFFGYRFGAYPYETLTVVDPCTDVGWKRLGGGMEYPTLITCGSRYMLHPQRLQPESVTVHEFGHQYWYGLSANNEPEEPWLDEGLDSYSEGRAQDLAYAVPLEGDDPAAVVGNPVRNTEIGPFVYGGVAPAVIAARGGKSWNSIATLERIPLRDVLDHGLGRLGIPTKGLRAGFETVRFRGTLLGEIPIARALRDLPFLSYDTARPHRSLWGDRLGYLNAPSKDVVRTAAWKFLDRQSYRTNSYPRPATILATLERMMGPDKWWPCIRRFHERSRFAHPTGDDFIATVREFGGDAIGDFAREALMTTKTLDYGIAAVDRNEEPARKGLFDDDERKDTKKRARVIVRRFGELRAPVLVRFTFGDRSTIEEVWELEDQGPWKMWNFEPETLEKRGDLFRVDVDPPDERFEVGEAPVGRLVLDSNLLNNSWRRTVNAKPAKRRSLQLMLWIECVMGFFGAMG